MNPAFNIGTSGWHYNHWRGLFYPEGLSKSHWLQYYSGFFSTVEVNNTFYRLPSERTVTGWEETVPQDFVFSVKASRLITHYKRLQNCEEPLRIFISRIRLLGSKLGPILYQLPSDFKRSDEKLDAFLSLLPDDLTHIFEFRSPTWFSEEVFALLNHYHAGFCAYHLVTTPCPLVATTDTVYFRFHGSEGVYTSCYSEKELEEWSSRLRDIGKDKSKVYLYFNNDAAACAVKNALEIKRFLDR